MKVILEEDPLPIVKIIGAQLRRALTHRDILKTAKSMQGSFALSSTTDLQRVTISITSNQITVRRGIEKDARIIIHMNLTNDDAPKVEGLWKHPLFAMKAGKLLNSPSSTWTDSAKQFWELVHDYPGMPNAVKLVCTDGEREFVMGTGDIDVEIYGSANNLTNLLSGSMVFVEGAMKGEIKTVTSLQHATILTEVTIKHMLGELGTSTGL